jgi:hypothetical protein
VPSLSGKHGRAAYRLIGIAQLALAVLASAVLGCSSDYRSLKVETGPTKDLRLGAAWDALAERDGFDGDTATFESLWLEYSPKSILLAGLFQTWTDGPRLLQVGFFSGDPSGDKPVQITGGLCIVDHPVAGHAPAGAVEAGSCAPLVLKARPRHSEVRLLVRLLLGRAEALANFSATPEDTPYPQRALRRRRVCFPDYNSHRGR